MFPNLERLWPRQQGGGTESGTDPNEGVDGIRILADSFGPDQNIITLDSIDNPALPAPPIGLKFSWTPDAAVELKNITWLGMSGPNQEGFEDIDVFVYGDDAIPSDGGDGKNGVMTRVQEYSVVLNIWGLETKDNSFINHPMAVRLSWEEDSTTRFSQASAFAVQGIPGNTEGDSSDIQSELDDLPQRDQDGYIGPSDLPGGEPEGPDGPDGGDPPSSTGAAPVPTATAPQTLTQLPSSTALPGDGNSDDDDGGSGGGLSTAATAGIAVGASVAGLAIIGLLIWFFLRRRRNKRKGYNEPHVSNTLMVEKDNQNHTSESVHTPYSDDGVNQIRDGPSIPPTHIGYATYDDSYHSPHDDAYQSTHHEPHAQPQHHHHQEPAMPRAPSRQHSGFEPMATPGSRSSSRALQTPEGVSRSVAHLVEEGMSAEEIRRLEEEERQLDDEIERAGRR